MMTNSSSKAIEAIEIKGRSLTVMVLHIKENDPRILYPQLEEKIEEAGALLGSSPVIIDVSAMVEEEQGALDFSYLKRALQGADLMPIGVQGAAGSQSSRIIQAGLPLMATNSKGPAPRKVTEQKKEPYTKPPQPEYDPEKDQPAASNVHPPPDTPPLPQTYSTAKVITQTVRSGQQIVAPEGDLIVLASVNAGSELFAAGNIHVYGTLQGCALAGIHGDTTARIFTLRGNPELVAIAGDYVVNERMPYTVLGSSFTTFWTENGLRFTVLGSFDPGI